MAEPQRCHGHGDRATELAALYSLLHQILHRRLDLRHVPLRVDTLAHDDSQLVPPLALSLRDGRLSPLDGLLDVQAVQVDRARRRVSVVLCGSAWAALPESIACALTPSNTQSSDGKSLAYAKAGKTYTAHTHRCRSTPKLGRPADPVVADGSCLPGTSRGLFLHHRSCM